jgi:N-acyl-D-amino-acid deacylase
MRTFLIASLAVLLAAMAPSPSPAAERPAEHGAMPITGMAVPELKGFDDAVAASMRKYGVPGGALAVTKDGRLVFAHGYGLADRDAKTPVQPDSLFRIASVTKTITSAAILALIEQGRLDLNAKVLDVLKASEVTSCQPLDARWKQITIRQLLQHTAGFDRDKSFDPMFQPYQIALTIGTPPPAEPMAIIRYMMTTQRLDFDPGAKFAYSNFGYCLLGRVIEQLTGKKYEEAVRDLVLKPAGITRMRIGRTLLSQRAPDEVRYYVVDQHKELTVFPQLREPATEPYGWFYMEALDAHGAWIASPIDLVRFACAIDGSRKPGLLKPETVALIDAQPAPRFPGKEEIYYGLGWILRPTGKDAGWSHDGLLPGTISLLVIGRGGVTWAVLFNQQEDIKGLHELRDEIGKVIGRVPKWPEGDLFPRY